MIAWVQSAVARWFGPAFLVAFALRATASLAAPAGAALVIGDSLYAGRSVLPACSQAARAVSDRLQHLGFVVDTAIDAPAISLRNALNSFADHVAAAPPGAAVVYVCAEGTAVGSRLFLLPSDVDLQQPLRPETQGVVVRALVNALAGSKGTLVAELSMPAGTNAAAPVSALRDTLPDGLHLAMTIGDGKPAGLLGMRLAGNAAEPDQGWERLTAMLQATPLNPAPALAVYTPTPAAPPPVAAAPVTLAPPPEPIAPPAPEKHDSTSVAPQVPAVAPPAPAPAAARPSPPPQPPRPAERPPERRVVRARPPAFTNGDERTRRLQIALAHRGFYGGPIDGGADAGTEQAIRAYQSSLGDRQSGTLTQTEIVRLLNNW
jgi:Putative peptidoglycan binding domain/Caspase domain